MSGLERGGEFRFLTLTSGVNSPASIQKSWRKLQMRMKRRGLYAGYLRVQELTKAGRPHLHVIIRGKYIAQAWLSANWEEIHNAKIVDIRKVKSLNSKGDIAGYLAKYVGKESAGHVSWSWFWVWRGFCKDWARLKTAFNLHEKTYGVLGFAVLLAAWRQWLHGGVPPDFTLLEVEEAYNLRHHNRIAQQRRKGGQKWQPA
jgi:hypothetical protein